jgi:flagellar motility protein MotE (MotC chaperone)
MKFRLTHILILSFVSLIILKITEISLNKDNNLLSIFKVSEAIASSEEPQLTDDNINEVIPESDDDKPVEKRWQHYDNVVNARNQNVTKQKPATVFDQNFCSKENMHLLEDLASRKEELDKWQQEFETKQNLLLATSDELDKKIIQLSELKSEVTKLIDQYDDVTKNKISNLVKIYEAMKPQEAAQIMSNLDMDLLIKVLDNMKQTKVAVIMGSLSPEKARDITMAYAAQKSFSSLK